MYYDEQEFLEAVKKSEVAEREAETVKAQVFSFSRSVEPLRPMTEEDLMILQKSHDAWELVMEIARRPSRNG